MAKRHDLTGKKFGRLTAIAPVKKPGDPKVYWECQCACGNTKVVLASNLTTGKTRSCGCIKSREYIPIDEIVWALKVHLMEDENLFYHHPELAELFVEA